MRGITLLAQRQAALDAAEQATRDLGRVLVGLAQGEGLSDKQIVRLYPQLDLSRSPPCWR